MAGMRISQAFMFTGAIILLLAGLFTPTTYGAEDGQFPVFPTVVEDGSVVAPASPAPLAETQRPETERSNRERENRAATSESGAFSPWGFVKSQFTKTVFGGESGVIFTLESLSSKPDGRGDLHYLISYVNNTNETLREVSIRVSLPKDLQYLDSDLRPDSKGNGAVVFDLGKVAVGEEGAIQLETRLKKKKAREVVLGATMAYEDIDGGRHTVTAATNNAFNESNGGLTASALDSVGGFIVWLFVITLLVALAFVSYHYLTLKASSRRVT